MRDVYVGQREHENFHGNFLWIGTDTKSTNTTARHAEGMQGVWEAQDRAVRYLSTLTLYLSYFLLDSYIPLYLLCTIIGLGVGTLLGCSPWT